MLKSIVVSITIVLVISIFNIAYSASYLEKRLRVIDNLNQDEVFGSKNQPSLFITFTLGRDFPDSTGDYALIVDVDGDGDFDDEPFTSYVVKPDTKVGVAKRGSTELVEWNITKTLSSLGDGTYEIAVVIDKLCDGKIDWSGEIDIDVARFTIDRILTITDVDADPKVFSPNGDGIKDTITIYYTLSESLYSKYSEVVITIGLENLVIPAKPTPSTMKGRNSVIWDGKDGVGRYVDDGEYTIKIDAKDQAGNTATASVPTKIKVKKKPPEVSSVNPARDSYVSTLMEVSATLKDNSGEGIDLTKSRIRLIDPSGNNIAGMQVDDGVSTIKWKLSTPLPGDGSRDGKYSVSINAFDKVGNCNNINYNFVYDTLFPQVISINPPNYATLSKSPSSIVIVMKDGTGSGTDLANTIKTLKIDGNVPAGSLTHNGIDTITYIPTITYDKGLHTIEISPTDFSGMKPLQPLKFQFTITVPEPPPLLSLSSSSLDLGTNSTKDSISISNSGGGKLIWSLNSELPAWLSVTPIKGEVEAGKSSSITITISREGLRPGTYISTFNIVSNGGNGSITINATIPEPPPFLTLSTTSLDFGTSISQSSFTIINKGGGKLIWSINDSQNWLKISPTNGEIGFEGNSIVTVNIIRQGLDVGKYTYAIPILSNGGNGSVNVTMLVPEPAPLLSVSSNIIDFETSVIEKSLNITNNGGGTLSWNINSTIPVWLKVSQTKGELLAGNTSSIVISTNRKDMKEGIYKADLSIASNGGNSSITITMTVKDLTPLMSLSPTLLNFNSETGEKIFTISNNGEGPLSWEIKQDLPEWLNVSETSGELKPGEKTSVKLSINKEMLNSEKNEHNLSITSNGGDGNVLIKAGIKIDNANISSIIIDANETVSKNDSFNVEIKIINIKDLAGYQMEIAYDPAILEAISVEEGDFLNKESKTYWISPNIDNKSGLITGIACAKLSKGGSNGDGTLANIKFKAKNIGTSYIKIQNIKLPDSKGKAIPVYISDIDVLVEEKSDNYPRWDINRDGKTDILDFVLIGQYFGERITSAYSPNPDVNRDGIVDILDFVIIGQHFGEVSTSQAPAKLLLSPYPEQIPILSRMYNIMENMSNNDPAFLSVKDLLFRIISINKPIKNQLLQNYPNPFNPETWIPYQLSKGSNVIIRIYNSEGQIVRNINLGYKPAGLYLNKSMSAYWDGKNDNGESVSSGIYFYTIDTGDFFDTKKMMIVK